MCFSATGSFGVAAVIAGIGAVALAQDKQSTERRPMILHAYSGTESKTGSYHVIPTCFGTALLLTGRSQK